MNKSLSSCLSELKKKGKVKLGNLKSVCGCLREGSLMRSFHYKVHVTAQMEFHKGGHNWSWLLTRVVATRSSTVFYRK